MNKNEEFNLYDILEVNQNSTKQQIKNSYKKLILKYHPDKNITMDNNFDYQKFIKIRYAYEILIDDEKRKDYDDKINQPSSEEEPNSTYRNVYSETYHQIIDKLYNYFKNDPDNQNKSYKNIISIIKNKIKNIDSVKKYLSMVDFNLLDINATVNYSLRGIYFNKNKNIKIKKITSTDVVEKNINPFIFTYKDGILNHKFQKEGEMISFMDNNIYGDLNINLFIKKSTYFGIDYNVLGRDIYTTFSSQNIKYGFLYFTFIDGNYYSFNISTLNKNKTDFGNLYYIDNMGLPLNDNIYIDENDLQNQIIQANRGKLFFVIIF